MLITVSYDGGVILFIAPPIFISKRGAEGQVDKLSAYMATNNICQF